MLGTRTWGSRMEGADIGNVVNAMFSIKAKIFLSRELHFAWQHFYLCLKMINPSILFWYYLLLCQHFQQNKKLYQKLGTSELEDIDYINLSLLLSDSLSNKLS